MAEDIEAALARYLASAPQNVRAVPVISFWHSAMSKTWHLWREPYIGSVTIEGGVVVTVEPANILPELAGTPANLDQVYKVALDITDGSDQFHEELDRIPLATTELAQLQYREYLSNDLTTPQASVRLEVTSITLKRGTAGIVASAPRFNATRTGSLYTPSRFPMLRAFL